MSDAGDDAIVVAGLVIVIISGLFGFVIGEAIFDIEPFHDNRCSKEGNFEVLTQKIDDTREWTTLHWPDGKTVTCKAVNMK